MRVKTLRQVDFERHCQSLQRLVAGSGFDPDLVIGIRTGGALMADIMFRKATHIDVNLQRPVTHRKRRLPRWVFRTLPYFALDALRMLESQWLSRRRPVPSNRPVDMPKELPVAERILIIDDAVDSGVTLEAVKRAVQALYPAAQIVTAVLTVTTNRPLLAPDFSIYNDKTLLRFPWSLDMKS